MKIEGQKFKKLEILKRCPGYCYFFINVNFLHMTFTNSRYLALVFILACHSDYSDHPICYHRLNNRMSTCLSSMNEKDYILSI